MKTPELTYVIPCFNGEAFLAEAIGSCISQSRKNIEILIIDDASTDATPRILDFYSKGDDRVKVHRNKRNIGRGAARNIGNSLASARYIAVLDSDDLAEKHRTDETLRLFARTPDAVVYGSAMVVDYLDREMKQLDSKAFDLKKVLEDGTNYIVHSTMAYPKDLALKVRYDEGEFAAVGLDDWKFGFDCMLAGVQFINSDKVLAAYRNHTGGVSAKRDPETVIRLKSEYMDAKKQLLQV